MKLKKSIFGCIAVVILVSCSTNPFTGKKTLALVPNSQLFPLAFQQYDQFLTENKVVKSGAQAQMITTVGQKNCHCCGTVFDS